MSRTVMNCGEYDCADSLDAQTRSAPRMAVILQDSQQMKHWSDRIPRRKVVGRLPSIRMG